MVLQLTFNELLRLERARGAAIDVLDGAVWITEDGRAADRFLGAGNRYHVTGDGLVVIGAENAASFAKVELRHGERPSFLQRLVAAWRDAQTERELRELPERTLRDIGIRVRRG